MEDVKINIDSKYKGVKCFILRAKYIADEYDDLIITSNEYICAKDIEDIIEDVKEQCDEVVCGDIILERLRLRYAERQPGPLSA